MLTKLCFYIFYFILQLLFMNCLYELFFFLHAFNKPFVNHGILYLLFLHVLVIFVHVSYNSKKCSKNRISFGVIFNECFIPTLCIQRQGDNAILLLLIG